MAKISGLDLIAKELKVHNSCCKNYFAKAKRVKDARPLKERTLHEDAINETKLYVQETLVENEGAEKLQSIFQRYLDALGTKETPYTAQKLCEKLLKEFPDSLKTCKKTNKEGLILYNHLLENEQAIRRANFDENNLKETSFYLRKLILSSPKSELPVPLSVDALEVGQANKPDELIQFFSILYTGNTKQLDKESTERLVDSVTDDVIFAVSHGRTKPGKHLCLALTLKSLTGSHRVIEIMNRFGHCISYHTAEEIETQLASEIAVRNRAFPDGMVMSPNLCTSLAWDNYDEINETFSGIEKMMFGNYNDFTLYTLFILTSYMTDIPFLPNLLSIFILTLPYLILPYQYLTFL